MLVIFLSNFFDSLKQYRKELWDLCFFLLKKHKHKHGIKRNHLHLYFFQLSIWFLYFLGSIRDNFKKLERTREGKQHLDLPTIHSERHEMPGHYYYAKTAVLLSSPIWHPSRNESQYGIMAKGNLQSCTSNYKHRR